MAIFNSYVSHYQRVWCSLSKWPSYRHAHHVHHLVGLQGWRRGPFRMDLMPLVFGGHRMGTSPIKGWNWWNRPSDGDIMRFYIHIYIYTYIHLHIYIYICIYIYYIKRTTWFLGTLPQSNMAHFEIPEGLWKIPSGDHWWIPRGWSPHLLSPAVKVAITHLANVTCPRRHLRQEKCTDRCGGLNHGR